MPCKASPLASTSCSVFGKPEFLLQKRDRRLPVFDLRDRFRKCAQDYGPLNLVLDSGIDCQNLDRKSCGFPCISDSNAGACDGHQSGRFAERIPDFRGDLLNLSDQVRARRVRVSRCDCRSDALQVRSARAASGSGAAGYL